MIKVLVADDHAVVRRGLRQILADPGIGNLLVVASYEPKTAGIDHPLTAMLQGLDQMATAVPIRPLPDSGLAGLLADTLHVSRGKVLPLAGVVAEKTRSNPLLLGQFLHHLREQELISRYFFIKYWLEGPHIRLRLLPSPGVDEDFVRHLAQTHIDRATGE